MRRRDVLALACGAAALAPIRAFAQQPLPVVGFLNSQSPRGWERLVEAFHKGLHEGGFIVGQTVAVESRWAEGRIERLPDLAAELVRRKVSVIVATGGSDPARAAKMASVDIPVVFTVGPDPVKLGLVDSLARPGGNLTGFTLFTRQLGPKRLEYLRELLPGARLIAALFNPDFADTEGQRSDIAEAARNFGLRLQFIEARSNDTEISAAFDNLDGIGAEALFVDSDPYYFAHRTQVTALAARHRVPAIYEARDYAAAGGLISYGVDYAEIYRQAGLYAARILKGAKPADLPVTQPVKFELVINQTTAKALGLTIPPLLLARADEVIE
jgi:putative tryptophan/tyrosine transport system substrate-binding protein